MRTAKVSEPTRITIIITMNGAKSMAEAMAEILTEYGKMIDLRLCYVDEIERRLTDDNTLSEDVVAELTSAEIVWFDVRGDTPTLRLIKEVLVTSGNVVLGHSMTTSLGSGMVWFERDQPWLVHKMTRWMSRRMAQRNTDEMRNGPGMGRMHQMLKTVRILSLIPWGPAKDIKSRATTLEYWLYGRSENTNNLRLYLAREYGGQKVKPLPPQDFPEYGIYHPLTREFFATPDDYLKKYPLAQAQTVGMLLLPGSNLHDSVVGAGEIMQRLEGKVNFIPIYSRDSSYWQPMRDFFFKI